MSELERALRMGDDENHVETRFYLNPFKLWSLVALLLGGAFFFAWHAVRAGWRPDTPEAPGTLALGALAVVLFALALVFRREARDPAPALEVTPEGLRDRRLGFVPWSDVDNYRLRGGMFTPCFGYDLRRGVRPERGALFYRVTGTLAWMGGLPRRNFRKAMIVGGLEPMLEACRAMRPDLERK